MFFLIIPVGILVLEHKVEGLNVLKTIQSMITISSLPVLVALIVLGISFGKALKEDIETGEILESIDDNKQNKWNIKK